MFFGWKGLWLNLFFVVSTAVILMYYKKRMGCITGDMLGAMTECHRVDTIFTCFNIA